MRRPRDPVPRLAQAVASDRPAGARALDGWAHRARALLLHPAWWAWPAAVVLMHRAPAGMDAAPLAVRRYYLPALALVLLGCAPSLRGAARRSNPPSATLLPRTALVWLTVAILAGALLLRLPHLTTWPPEGMGFEEFEIA